MDRERPFPSSVPDPRLVSMAAMVFVDDPLAPVLAGPDAHHLLEVLRLRPGEAVAACDGLGTWTPCRVSAGRGDGADPSEVLSLDGEPVREPEGSPAIAIAFAPVKGDRPEWVVQKLTELGVDRIVPIWTRRSVVRWEGARAARSVERLRRVAREAAAQCRRAWLPSVEQVIPLDGVADLVGSPPVLARPGGARPSLARPVVAIGPEGGWDEGELAAYGPGIGLGPTVLRAETAAVLAAGLLCGIRSGVIGPLRNHAP